MKAAVGPELIIASNSHRQLAFSVDDATPGLVGFLRSGSLTAPAPIRERTPTRVLTFFGTPALPNSTSTMRLSLPYLHVFSGGVSQEDEDSFPSETNSVVMGGWNTRSLTSTFPDYSNKNPRRPRSRGRGHLLQQPKHHCAKRRCIRGRGRYLHTDIDRHTLSRPVCQRLLRNFALPPNDDHSDRTLGWEWDDGILLLDTEVHRQELSSSETGSNLWGSDIYFAEADGVNTHGHSFVDDTVNSATTYRYRLRVKTHWESSEWSGVLPLQRAAPG